MDFLLLGIGIGLLTLLPPGPITVTLVQLAGTSGHSSAIRGAVGIASGDLVVAIPAVAIVGAGTALPASAFATLQLASAAVLLLLGAILTLRPDVAEAVATRIQRPGRTMFALTTLTPTVLGSWIAMLAAMPFANDLGRTATFALGVVVASFVWHPLLGYGAASIGTSISTRSRRRLSRAGGLSMTTLALWLAVTQLID